MHELTPLVEMRETWKYEDTEYITLRRKLCNHACCKHAPKNQWILACYKNPSTKKKHTVYIGHPDLNELIRRYIMFLQSRWDILPPEIQKYIVDLADSQYQIDKREMEKQRADLFYEIRCFGRLRDDWTLRNVRCCYEPCKHANCVPGIKRKWIPNVHYHPYFEGYYVNRYKEKKTVQLDITYYNASQKVHYCKLFLGL